MAVLEFIFVISVGILLSLGVFNTVKAGQRQQQLENAFYQILEANNGEISLIQLAARSKVEADLAKQYLENQAKAFSATLEVDEDGDTFYRFPKLRRSLHS